MRLVSKSLPHDLEKESRQKAHIRSITKLEGENRKANQIPKKQDMNAKVFVFKV